MGDGSHFPLFPQLMEVSDSIEGLVLRGSSEDGGLGHLRRSCVGWSGGLDPRPTDYSYKAASVGLAGR